MKEGTPHCIYPPASKTLNSYQKAILDVGSVLTRYNSDGLIPTLGFGAKLGSKILHCFQCGDEAEVKGVQGVMDAYRGVFRKSLVMSFPTDFTEVIETASTYARSEMVSFTQTLLYRNLFYATLFIDLCLPGNGERGW